MCMVSKIVCLIRVQALLLWQSMVVVVHMLEVVLETTLIKTALIKSPPPSTEKIGKKVITLSEKGESALEYR